jgi:hypothetical protein
MSLLVRLLAVVILPAAGFCQLPSSRCDNIRVKLDACPYSVGGTISTTNAVNFSAAISERVFRTPQPKHRGFRWRRALFESFVFLSIEQAYVVHMDYHWVTVENGVPFNHYWDDYTHSLSTWVHSGWNDGDPALYNYVGHPIQGAMTSFIQIQNDPQGEKLEFSNTREYWWSRFKATMWNAAYSTQWSIGPLSEMTVEKYGTEVRSPWNEDGSWPCTHRDHCLTGVGQVNLVITPVGGFGWILGEDLLDKYVARRVEGSTRNNFLIGFTRCAVNPIRGGANILHGKPPWYRASRDAREVYVANQARKHAFADNSFPQ